MRRFAFALLVLTAGCGPQPTPPPSTDAGPPEVSMAAPSTPEVPLDAAMGAILPADKGQTFAKQCSRISPGPITATWTPSAAAIVELEASLGAEIERQLAATSAAGSKPEAYYRQYAGLTIDGRPVIYVNGIDKDAVARAPEAQRDLWKTEPAVICDGGTITFGVEYDPATKTFSNFAFNGAL
jgi:hypothetical protein